MSARSIRRTNEREARRRGRRIARRAGLSVGAAAATAAIAAPGAQAANFPVSNTLDSGAGSLRAAITSANGTPAADTVTFTGAGASGEIRLLTEIPITDDLTISGPGAGQLAISGDAVNNNVRDFATSAVALGDTRIFSVSDPTTPGSPLMNVTISGLTLREGVADDWTGGGPQNKSGGAIYANDVDLTLSNTTFSDNVSTSGGGAVDVGSTNDISELNVSNSTFNNNRALSNGGAISVRTDKYGFEDVRAHIANSQITNNIAGGTNFGGFGYNNDPDGGGVYNKYGGVAITGSTIAGNTAQTTNLGAVNGDGGGLKLAAFSTVTSSTISGNTAGDEGGGVYLVGSRLVRSTVSGNAATVGEGGGVIAGTGKYGGATRIDESTISGNSATGTIQFSGLGGGLLAFGYDLGVRVRNSTVAGNTATQLAGGLVAYAQDQPVAQVDGTIVADNLAAGAPSDTQSLTYDSTAMAAVDFPGGVAAGFSLVEAPKSALAGAPAGSNITGVDPKLSPLAANGGPTQTMAIAPTSPAVDSAQANGFTTDQTGNPRTVDAAATNSPLSDGTDIGAFELQDASATGGDPSTDFSKKPPKKVKLKKGVGKVKLQFSGTVNSGAPGPLTFECKVDKAEFVNCSSPLKLKLAKGKHTVEVRAVDSTGRVDSSPAKAKIKVKKAKKK